MRWILIGLAITCAAATARAAPDPETVALLPLATGKGFELYGQPVAAEVARALRAGGLEVVVVSVGATPPARARLVVDGTIAAGPHGAVALTVRVRDPRKGVVVATLDASAPELTALDHAAADLSARLLRSVQEQLAARDPAPEPPRPVPPVPPPAPKLPPAPELPAALAYGTSVAEEFPDTAAAELARALVARTGHRAVDAGAPPDGKSVAGDFELAVEIESYDVQHDGVWTARGSARIRWIAADGHVQVDHVVYTDTLVGSRKDDRAAMVRYVAAQLADIVRPRLAGWAQGR